MQLSFKAEFYKISNNICIIFQVVYMKFRKHTMSILEIVLAILLPPLAVGLKKGIGSAFLINILLTLVGWLPGVIHAFYVLSRRTV